MARTSFEVKHLFCLDALPTKELTCHFLSGDLEMTNTSFLDSISDKRLPTLSTKGTQNRSHVTNRDARSNSMAFSSPLVISQRI
jgi:hypothetical protein